MVAKRAKTLHELKNLLTTVFMLNPVSSKRVADRTIPPRLLQPLNLVSKRDAARVKTDRFGLKRTGVVHAIAPGVQMSTLLPGERRCPALVLHGTSLAYSFRVDFVSGVESDDERPGEGDGTCGRADSLEYSGCAASLVENRAIADMLDEIATLLAHQGASEFRVRAYQAAGDMLRKMSVPVRDVLDREGMDGLVSLPTIGQSIGHVVEQYLHDGRTPLLDRLRGDETAERLFESLPGLGPGLAHRIHEQLEIETLPELMAAIEDGRLKSVPGIGRKRLHALRESLMVRLRHPQGALPDLVEQLEPNSFVPVSELLDVDVEYRQLAAKGKLPKIAPRRFNPDSIAWLPILHTHRGARHYTAIYSNTARATN